VESDELTGDRRLTVLRQLSGHLRHIVVTSYNSPLLAGVIATIVGHQFTALVTFRSSDRRASSLKFLATAHSYYKLKPL
jgi:hypothetical protein